MKKIFLVLAIATIATSANAQDTRDKVHLYSLGLEAALPVGDFGNYYSFGIGGTVQYEYKDFSNVGITLNAGYITYSGKDISNSNYGLIPVLAGVKYYFSGGAYAHGQLGIGMETGSFSNYLITNFMYAPGIGYMLAPGFDAELKYAGIGKSEKETGNSNFIGLRLAYNF